MSVAETITEFEPAEHQVAQRLDALLDRQRQAFLKDGYPSAAVRKDRLSRAIALLVDHQKEIADALDADFGCRSKDMSLFTDVVAPIDALKHARSHVTSWMKPDRRMATFPFNLMGGRAQVMPQPKGVVGLISPWNFPVQLTFGPLASILSAGNRAMIKPSEFTPETSALLGRMFREAFDETEIAVVEGGPEVGKAFSGLAFDHIIFTGSTRIGREVMRSAAENLVPVTLELGGKSPVIVGKTADLETAAQRIMAGKLMNAGQICLAPDYVYVPEDQVKPFVEACRQAVRSMYPTIKDNPEYTSIVNSRQYGRLMGIVDEAKESGAEIVELNPAQEDLASDDQRKVVPTIALNTTPDMRIMQEELFGPVMPVHAYSDVSDVIDEINSRPRPLGLYYFGSDSLEEKKILTSTTSGGVTVNDVIFHVVQDNLPFGGVGPSGMGNYHGKDGFRTFSHQKAVYRQTPLESAMKMFRPPYTDMFRKTLNFKISR